MTFFTYSVCVIKNDDKHGERVFTERTFRPIRGLENTSNDLLKNEAQKLANRIPGAWVRENTERVTFG